MIIDGVESFPIFLFPIAFFNLQNCKISFVTRVVIKNRRPALAPTTVRLAPVTFQNSKKKKNNKCNIFFFILNFFNFLFSSFVLWCPSICVLKMAN